MAFVGIFGLLLIAVSLVILAIGLLKKNPGMKGKGWKCLGIGFAMFAGALLLDGTPSGAGAQASSSPAQASAPREQQPAAQLASSPSADPAPAVQQTARKDEIPREYRSALKSAEQYLSVMPFSKKGLYHQLSSQAGSKYPAEAARYAVENVKTDWRQNALRAAEHYLETMPFSKKGLYSQLTSSAGSQFPADEARYAVENVKTDWKQNALRAAEHYQETMPMSKRELYQQLTSPAGENFTKEEANYAISHLTK